MQAIELTAQITEKHEIHLKLPEKINADSVKVIVMYEKHKIVPHAEKRVFGQFRGKIKILKSFDDDFCLGQ